MEKATAIPLKKPTLETKNLPANSKQSFARMFLLLFCNVWQVREKLRQFQLALASKQ